MIRSERSRCCGERNMKTWLAQDLGRSERWDQFLFLKKMNYLILSRGFNKKRSDDGLYQRFEDVQIRMRQRTYYENVQMLHHTHPTYLVRLSRSKPPHSSSRVRT